MGGGDTSDLLGQRAAAWMLLLLLLLDVAKDYREGYSGVFSTLQKVNIASGEIADLSQTWHAGSTSGENASKGRLVKVKGSANVARASKGSNIIIIVIIIELELFHTALPQRAQGTVSAEALLRKHARAKRKGSF